MEGGGDESFLSLSPFGLLPFLSVNVCPVLLSGRRVAMSTILCSYLVTVFVMAHFCPLKHSYFLLSGVPSIAVFMHANCAWLKIICSPTY